MYQDLSTRHDWPVEKPLSIWQSGWKEKKRTSVSSLNLFGAQNKDLAAASQTSLIVVKLRLRRRLP